MAQKQYPFLVQKYGNFSQVTLKIQKTLTFSNQILNLGSLKTVHAVCAGRSYIADIGFIRSSHQGLFL